MTTPEHPPAPDLAIESVDANASADASKPVIPAFTFPFKPGELAQAKKDQPYYQKSGKSSHEKRPGAAPSPAPTVAGPRGRAPPCAAHSVPGSGCPAAGR